MERKYYSGISFLDLLFNLLLGFVALFLISFLMIAEAKKKTDSNIKTKAEYVITVTWPNDSADDVDTWLEDPLGNTMFFRVASLNIGTAHLDRDDLGHVGDMFHVPGQGMIKYSYNQEITTIRMIVKGEWCLNLHMYKKRGPTPTEVQVKMIKLNPTAQIVLLKTVVFTETWQEETILRFMMSKQGNIVARNELPKALVRKNIERM